MRAHKRTGSTAAGVHVTLVAIIAPHALPRPPRGRTAARVTEFPVVIHERASGANPRRRLVLAVVCNRNPCARAVNQIKICHHVERIARSQAPRCARRRVGLTKFVEQVHGSTDAAIENVLAHHTRKLDWWVHERALWASNTGAAVGPTTATAAPAAAAAAATSSSLSNAHARRAHRCTPARAVPRQSLRGGRAALVAGTRKPQATVSARHVRLAIVPTTRRRDPGRHIQPVPAGAQGLSTTRSRCHCAVGSGCAFGGEGLRFSETSVAAVPPPAPTWRRRGRRGPILFRSSAPLRRHRASAQGGRRSLRRPRDHERGQRATHSAELLCTRVYERTLHARPRFQTCTVRVAGSRASRAGDANTGGRAAGATSPRRWRRGSAALQRRRTRGSPWAALHDARVERAQLATGNAVAPGVAQQGVVRARPAPIAAPLRSKLVHRPSGRMRAPHNFDARNAPPPCAHIQRRAPHRAPGQSGRADIVRRLPRPGADGTKIYHTARRGAL